MFTKMMNSCPPPRRFRRGRCQYDLERLMFRVVEQVLSENNGKSDKTPGSWVSADNALEVSGEEESEITVYDSYAAFVHF